MGFKGEHGFGSDLGRKRRNKQLKSRLKLIDDYQVLKGIFKCDLTTTKYKMMVFWLEL